MAVWGALSTADSREDMAAMELSKGAMAATAMVALQPMAPSKATAGTPTTPGVTLGEDPADQQDTGSSISEGLRWLSPYAVCKISMCILSGDGFKMQGMQI